MSYAAAVLGAAVGAVVSKAIELAIQGIESAIQESRKKREEWVRKLAQDTFTNIKEAYGVMVIRESHLKEDWEQHCKVIHSRHVELPGSGIGNDWGSIGFRVIVVASGYIINNGDGGYINWCFYKGNKDGMKAVFG